MRRAESSFVYKKKCALRRCFFAEGGFRQVLLYAEKVYTEYHTNDEPVKEKSTFGFAPFPPFPSFFVYASAKSTRN